MAAGGDDIDLGALGAELFGDYNSDDEGAKAGGGAGAPKRAVAAATAAASSSAAPGAAAANEEDLFGDFDSDEEPAPGASGSGALAGKRPAPAPRGERKAKAARGGDAMKFFELEAEEAGAGSEEEEADDLEGLIDDRGDDRSAKGRAKDRSALQRAQQQAELAEVQADIASRGPDVGARRVFGSSFLDRLEEKFKDAYEEKDDAERDDGQAAPRTPGERSVMSAGRGEATNTHIVPASTDPKIWCCKTFGPENQLCIALMIKAGEFFAKGQKVPIFSAFYSLHLRGYIYIEAFREADIRDFIKGIRGISPWGISVVPVAQMPLVFQASVTHAGEKDMLKVGDWVRLKHRLYAGDLAKIEEVRDQEVTIRVKPRIQYQIESGGKALDKASRDSRKRPAARWFNKSDVEAAGMMVNTIEKPSAKGRHFFYMVADEIYREGFLFKTLKSHQLITGDQVRPQEREVQDWGQAPPLGDETVPPEEKQRRPKEEHERKMMPPPPIPSKRASAVELVEGDVVIVNSGELVNLKGRIIKAIFRSKTVTVRPLGTGTDTPDLNLAISTLSKYFEVGDYIKVLDGEHCGDVGYVMAVDFKRGPKWNRDSTCKVLSSSLTTEFEVPVEGLRLTAQKADHVREMGEYRVGQLVALSGAGGNARGVIVRLEVGTRASVLTTTGQKYDVAFSDIVPTRDGRGRDVWTTDRKGEKLRVGCAVKAPRSFNKSAPIRASIDYIIGDTCFLTASAGLCGERAFLVAPGKRCELIYDLSLMEDLAAGKDRSKKAEESPNQQGMLQYGVQMASQTNWLQPWFKKMMGMPSDASNVTTKGSHIRIMGGAYKGLRAEVRDFLGDKVRVSLLAKPKLITVDLPKVAPDDYSGKQRQFKTRGSSNGGAPQEAPAPGTPIDEEPLFLSDPATIDPAAVAVAEAAAASGVEALQDGPAASASGDESASQSTKPKRLPEEEQPLNNDNSWDPMFLMPKRRREDKAFSDDEDDAPLSSKPSPSGGAQTAPPSSSAPSTPRRRSGAESGAAGAAAGPGAAAPSTPSEPATPTGEAGSGSGGPRLPVRKKSRVSRIPSEVTPSPHQSPHSSTRRAATTATAFVPSSATAGAAGAAASSGAAAADGERQASAATIASRHKAQDRGWMTAGVGVRFSREGVPTWGWLLKLGAGETADIVPAMAPVGDITVVYTLPVNQLSPWAADSRGDSAVVLSGPKRGTRGKIAGIDKSTVYLRPEGGGKIGRARSSTFAAVSGSGMVTVEKHSLVKYHSDWEAAIREGRTASEPQPGTDGELDGEEEKAWDGWSVGQPGGGIGQAAPSVVAGVLPVVDVEAAVAVGAPGEETPDIVGVTNAAAADPTLLGESPMTVGDRTPVAMLVSETPDEKTLIKQAAVPGATPLGATPLGVTPLGGTPLGAPGGPTPFPGPSGSATPMLPGFGHADVPTGVETPQDYKVKMGTPLTPLPPGASTPMLHGLGGSVTPVPFAATAGGVTGPRTPEEDTKGSATPTMPKLEVPKGEGTGGEATPIVPSKPEVEL